MAFIPYPPLSPHISRWHSQGKYASFISLNGSYEVCCFGAPIRYLPLLKWLRPDNQMEYRTVA